MRADKLARKQAAAEGVVEVYARVTRQLRAMGWLAQMESWTAREEVQGRQWSFVATCAKTGQKVVADWILGDAEVRSMREEALVAAVDMHKIQIMEQVLEMVTLHERGGRGG